MIRGAWDTDARSVRVDGEHYRVAGVHPGPAPLHDVEIWIGAIGPKMLELTGRVGDGWLPSQSYVPPDTLAERNARIDDAAVARGPRPGRGAPALQRHARPTIPPGPSGSPSLTLTHGISTFIVSGDDPATIQRFGTEVAPAVRDLVGAERAGTPVAGAASAVPDGRCRADDARRRRTPQRRGAVGRVDAAVVRLTAPAAGLDQARARDRSAPRRRARPPAQRARPAVRPDRPGRGRARSTPPRPGR